MLVRLQKFLAEAGLASRRASEEIILSGRVRVNGEIVRKLGTKIHPDRDKISVDDQALRPRKKLYVALHKPPGYLSTRRDPAGRRILADLLPKEWRNIYPVGRLDNESEGLIFLTNDGQFSLHLTHPRYGTRKTYLVSVEGRVERALLEKFVQGVPDCGEILKADRARLLSASNRQSVIELELTEGKNREIRRLFASQGLTILRLLRTKIGPIKLGELPQGKWRTLTEPEIKSLLCTL